MKSAVVQARVSEELKKEAIEILTALGLSPSEAINIFLKQIVLNHGLPFEVKIPNQTTIDAMNEAKSGNLKSFDTLEELFKELDN